MVPSIVANGGYWVPLIVLVDIKRRRCRVRERCKWRNGEKPDLLRWQTFFTSPDKNPRQCLLSYLEQADPVVVVDADGLHGNGVHAVLLDPERVERRSGVGLILADLVAVYLHLEFRGERFGWWRRISRFAYYMHVDQATELRLLSTGILRTSCAGVGKACKGIRGCFARPLVELVLRWGKVKRLHGVCEDANRKGGIGTMIKHERDGPHAVYVGGRKARGRGTFALTTEAQAGPGVPRAVERPTTFRATSTCICPINSYSQSSVVT